MSDLIRESVDLESLEQVLQSHLDDLGLSSVVLGIQCSESQDILRVTVEGIDADLSDLQKIFESLTEILDNQNLSEQYGIVIYWSLDSYPQKLETMIAQKKIKQTLLKLFRQDYYAKFNYGQLTEKFSYQTFYKTWQELQEKKLQRFFLITGVTGLTVLGGIYTLTRPCVVGSCQMIEEVKQQTSETITLLENSPSELTMLETKQQLEKSINVLKSIPWWSNYYHNALNLEQTYQQELDYLAKLISTNNLDNQIASIAHSNSISTGQWKQLHQQLEDAIISLKTIPQRSHLQDIATVKIEDYQTILSRFYEKLSKEQQANFKFKLAKEASDLAQKRQNNANNLSDLQLVVATWKTAIKRLQEIPPGTSVYQPSKSLLKTYVTKLSQGENRKSQEVLAVKLHEQGIDSAKLAQKAESEKQWSQAVNHWKTALNYLNQMPKNTFQRTKSQALIPNYTLALNRAQTQLTLAMEVEKLRSDLATICTNPSQICNYIMDERGIKINLTSDYIAQVWNTALQAKVQGNLQIQSELLNHLSSFEYRLQGISDRTGKPIEVYNAQGILMAVYHRRQ